MNKLIINQNNANSPYGFEINEISQTLNEIPKIDLDDLSISKLTDIDVTISCRLPKKWEIILKGLKIISIVIDSYRL